MNSALAISSPLMCAHISAAAFRGGGWAQVMAAREPAVFLYDYVARDPDAYFLAGWKEMKADWIKKNGGLRSDVQARFDALVRNATEEELERKKMQYVASHSHFLRDLDLIDGRRVSLCDYTQTSQDTYVKKKLFTDQCFIELKKREKYILDQLSQVTIMLGLICEYQRDVLAGSVNLIDEEAGWPPSDVEEHGPPTGC